VISLPKPEKRAPKPRKRIARGKRPRKQRKTTPAKLAREADKLWRTLVKIPGVCGARHIGPASGLGPGCSGSLQAAHGISRRYRHTRWQLINGFCLCQAHHTYWTHRPLEWDVYLRNAWGETVYNELRLIALRPFQADPLTALEALREEAKARGLEIAK
jgi:hypothetical protein